MKYLTGFRNSPSGKLPSPFKNQTLSKMLITEDTVADYIICFQRTVDAPFLRAKQIGKFLKFNKNPNKSPNSITFQHRPLLGEYSYLLFAIPYLKTIIP